MPSIANSTSGRGVVSPQGVLTAFSSALLPIRLECDHGVFRHTMAKIRAHGSDVCPLRKKYKACAKEEHDGVQPAGPARLMPRQLERCALALSGHTLKCGLRSWARVIDNTSHYDAVFRTNTYPHDIEGPSGVRTDVAYRQCHLAPKGASCVTDHWLQW